eukprot:m.152431 g.152431  ORF g.152431 m.152431 type:complete len:143 (+) comp11704_c3_seq22:2498-2926(+)
MTDDEVFFPAQSHAPGWPPRTKFTMLAYAYKLQQDGEEFLPFEFKVSDDRVGWMVVKRTSPRRGGLPSIHSLILKVKAAITDHELDTVYGKPVVVITSENINDPMVNMDFKERFRNYDHPIDLEHLKDRFLSITRIEDQDQR